jgi:hypothetical protein
VPVSGALGIYSGMRIDEIIAIKQSQIYTVSGGVKNAFEVVDEKQDLMR